MKSQICRLHDKHDLRVETIDVPDPGEGEALVAIGAAGICGCDLHYFHDGGFGKIRLREPMILGHEAAGTVLAVGSGVSDLSPGDKVAVNPSLPCGNCSYCAAELWQHCVDMHFLGSAMRMPHEQGAFRQVFLTNAARCVVSRSDASVEELACAEPLAVCLHARNAVKNDMTGKIGDLSGCRVLVTGAGPIGALVTAAARHGGAKEIVVTDIVDETLDVVRKMGATSVINVAKDSQSLETFSQGKGYFDVAFECSGAPSAIAQIFATMRPKGQLVQVGIGGQVEIPLNVMIAKEIQISGSHRFHPEFALAVELISSRQIDVTPIITDRFAANDAVAAFERASDRTKAVKVLITFDGQ